MENMPRDVAKIWFSPYSSVLYGHEEHGVRGMNERGKGERREKRVDLPSTCSHNKLHSEWADTVLKYA